MLRFDSVGFSYKGSRAPALDGFSLEAEPGRVMAVLGPNGCGKSTALGIAAGWLKPSSGSFRNSGKASFLPQSERLAYAFTCLEYASFGRAPHLAWLGTPGPRDRELALAALARVGMEGKAGTPITALSGGELQLVRIARALAQDSPWMILDEPTDMLDPGHAVTVGSTIVALAAAGTGILLSTHDLAFALSVVDEAALVKDGRVLATGPAAGILDPARLGGLYGVPFGMATVPAPLHAAAGAGR